MITWLILGLSFHLTKINGYFQNQRVNTMHHIITLFSDFLPRVLFYLAAKHQ